MNAAASQRLATGITSISSTTAASCAFEEGTKSPLIPSCLAAAMAIDKAPLTPRVWPSRDSSPTTAYSLSRSDWTWLLPTSIPRDIGKSKLAACLGSSAGARLMTIRSWGRRKPALTSARSTRWVLSRTACSGRPTRTVLGNAEAERSTSTSTGTASIPTKLYVLSFASMHRAPGVESPKNEGNHHVRVHS